MFRDRHDAARQLAHHVTKLALHAPLVLGVPRGGAVTAAVLAQEIGAEFDIVLARKLRAPYQPELAVGAVGESGNAYITDFAHEVQGVTDAYLEEERRIQEHEIARRRARYRALREAAPVAGRSVIVTDDGVATGATMIAALQTLRPLAPRELIVAVPVIGADTVATLTPLCDRVVAVLTPHFAGAVGSYYWNFEPVEDEEVDALLRGESVRIAGSAGPSPG